MSRWPALSSTILALAFAACSQAPAPMTPAATPGSQPPAAPGPATGAAEETHKSDLDRPLEELFSEVCEHGKKTFECDECRYGVGVVRAGEPLFENKLLGRAVVGRQRPEVSIKLTGEIRFDERRVTHMTSSVEGVIRAARVGLGDAVKAGQALVEIESAAVAAASGDYLEAQAFQRLVETRHARQEQLRNEQVTSEREYQQARQELEAAEIRASSAGERLLSLGLSTADLEALRAAPAGSRGRLTLRAPAAGTVLQMHAVPGEIVRPEEGILTIGDSSSLWVWADLYERDLAEVLEHKAQGSLRATVSARAFAGEQFPGSVDFIGPTMDEGTRTVKVRIGLPNQSGKLRAGMFVTVQLWLPSDEAVLAVPAAAVLTDEGRSFIFLHHHDDYYVRRPLTAGRRWEEWVEVKGGLKGGETIVADGCFLLKSDVLRSKMGAGCAD
jgi:membrane fusion protein, heavy metal efflux system